MQVGQYGNQEVHAEVLCRRHRALRAIAARANSQQCKIKPLLLTFLRYTSAEQGRRRSMPRFCVAGAGGVATVGTCVGAAA
jgi:hypothetical protein